MFQYGDSTDDPFMRGERLAIGVDSLDMREPRGIPAGSTVSILGDPRGMADLFLMHLIRTGRPTVYLSTVRTEASIREELSAMGDGQAANLTIVEVFAVDEDVGTVLTRACEQLDTGYNLIVDSATNLAALDGDRNLVDHLRPVSRAVAEHDSLAYLYFPSTGVEGLARDEREVLHLSDAVFHVAVGVHNDRIQTRVQLLKLRGSEIPDEVIKFKVGECLRVDTSRDIG